jgi:mono/diheme cytochrome c family protein
MIPLPVESQMKSTTVAATFLGAILVFISGAGYTADKVDIRKIDIGKAEYEQKCIICHGILGKGDGAYGQMLKKPATDLTVLSKNNGGVFPFAHVFETIEGTHELKAHGTREMPIWGKEYRSSKYYDEYLYDSHVDRSYFARSRILALTEYIYRLQGK